MPSILDDGKQQAIALVTSASGNNAACPAARQAALDFRVSVSVRATASAYLSRRRGAPLICINHRA